MNFISKKFVNILISLIFIGVIFTQVDLNRTLSSFSLINPVYLAIIPVYWLSFIVRAFRWKIFLQKGDLKFKSLLSSIFVGFSLNCILPARAGEIYRAYFFSKKENLGKTRVFTSVILERIFDGVTLFLILIGAIYWLNPGDLFSRIAFTAGIVFFTGFMVLLSLVKVQKAGIKREKIKTVLTGFACFLPQKGGLLVESLINKGFSLLNTFIESLNTLDSYKTLAKSIFLSFLIWFIEGFFIFIVIKSFGVDVSLFEAMLVLTITAFSTLIPAGPAGIGPYQWGYIIALKVFGIGADLGLAISIINQSLSIILVFSACALLMCRESAFWQNLKDKLENKPELL